MYVYFLDGERISHTWSLHDVSPDDTDTDRLNETQMCNVPFTHGVVSTSSPGMFISQKVVMLSTIRQHLLQHTAPIHPDTKGAFKTKHKHIFCRSFPKSFSTPHYLSNQPNQSN